MVVIFLYVKIEEEDVMSKKTDKNKNKSVNQYEVGEADLEKVSGGRRKIFPPIAKSQADKNVRRLAAKRQ